MSETTGLTEADLIIYGAMVVIGLIVIIMICWSIKDAKKQEEIGNKLTVDDVLRHYSKRLPSKNFLWATWKGQLSLKKLELFVKNEKGEDVAKITYHSLPQGDVTRTIDIAEHKYECLKSGLTSTRTALRDSASGQTVMSCNHKIGSQIYYEGDSDKIKFTLHHLSSMIGTQTIKVEDREVGQLISMYEFKCNALLLTFPDRNIDLHEKLFILASIPTGS